MNAQRVQWGGTLVAPVVVLCITWLVAAQLNRVLVAVQDLRWECGLVYWWLVLNDDCGEPLSRAKGGMVRLQCGGPGCKASALA